MVAPWRARHSISSATLAAERGRSLFPMLTRMTSLQKVHPCGQPRTAMRYPQMTRFDIRTGNIDRYDSNSSGVYDGTGCAKRAQLAFFRSQTSSICYHKYPLNPKTPHHG